MKKFIVIVILSAAINLNFAQKEIHNVALQPEIKTGASRVDVYLPMLKNKHVAIVGNQTSIVGNKHLVDTLISLGIKIDKIFCPEHGFRGQSEAGAVVASTRDSITKIPVVSLYGNNKKPTAEQLKGIEIVVFDLQDVGVRFYTYISTLHYVMEACAEQKIPLMVLDRPNPNGYFVDGPVLKTDCKSFVGMHPVPIAYGMTIGEYAKMINGEKWLNNGVQCSLTVIPLIDYLHSYRYKLPVAPSPNLTTMNAVYLYPSLCLFEGTPISIGRGTPTPFEVVGHPMLKDPFFSFTPRAIAGKSENPPCKDQVCNGYNLSEFSDMVLKNTNEIHLFWLIDIYRQYPDKKNFFTPFFDKLAGDKSLKEMIIAGKSEEIIKKSWQPELNTFKQIRKKYLLYPDFE